MINVHEKRIQTDVGIPLHTVWLFAALAIFGGIATIAYRSIDSIFETSRLVEETHQALDDLEHLLSDLKDAETGQRGYLATGDERMLEPYREALRNVPESLRALDNSLSHDTRQRNALIALGNNVRLRLRVLAMPVESRRNGVTNHPEQLEIMAHGKFLMDDIRAQIAVMKGHEESLLARRSLAERADAEHAQQLIVIGNMCAAALLLGSFYLLRRENQRRRAAEEIAHRNAAEVQDLYDQAPCGYHSCDENAIFVNVNETGLQWLGYTREELIGKMSFLDVLTESSRPTFIENFQRDKEQGCINDVELEMRRKDGSTMIVSVSAALVRDKTGKYLMSRSTLFDITERHRARQEIERLNEMLRRRATELEGANKELESFSYTVSHDLRAPLRAINGFAMMLEEDFHASLNGEGRRLLSVIRDSARRMGALIDDLLAFSRLGRTHMQRVRIDMRELVEEILGELRQGDGLGVATIAVEKLPPAYGDRSLLRQAWSNVIGNAIKYSGNREQPEIRVQGYIDGDEVIYSVEDNGVGFDMRFYDKLFGVFQRLHEANQFPGTGVGLAIVHRVIDRHSGRVWAKAAPDRGATFYFSLPVAHDATLKPRLAASAGT